MDKEYISRLKNALEKHQYSINNIEYWCSYAKNLIEKNLPVIFDQQNISEIFRLNEINLFSYHTYTITTKNKSREISAPSRNIKLRQSWILLNILERYPLPECVHGFVKGKSIVTNASTHLRKKYILCMDIKHFFPSISFAQVTQQFELFGYTKSVSDMLALLCTHQDILPQGAPTSPYLANLVFSPIDQELQTLALKKHFIYTRYADDITVSSDEFDVSELIPEITHICEKYGFTINEEKTHIMKDNYRKIVTGLLVNDTLKVPRSYKQTLRQEIYYCKKYGIDQHLKAKGSSKCVNYQDYLYGKAYYINMVEPSVGLSFLDQLDSIFSTL